MIAHAIIWTTIYFLLIKCPNNIGTVISRLCVTVPCALYLLLILGMSVSGFHFSGKTNMEKEITQQKRDDDPFDYWADIRGFYRTSILTVDYSGAFSGILLFATSRLRPGAKSLNALMLVPLMM
ncbi:unnamed protein product, partial [Cylicostephanus goldi]